MAQPKKTLYEILGVPRDANEIDVGLAYEKRTAELQRAVPPDPGAESLLHEAYEVLNNPRRRAAYDASLVTAAERAAAAEQAEPDLVVTQETEEKPRMVRWAAFAGAAVVVFAILYLALRPDRLPPPETRGAPEPVAAAPKPVVPEAPKALAGVDILKRATTSGGRLVSVEMSGRSTPIGMALSVEPNAMITTCHGIQAGRKLVVLVGPQTIAADPSITDETLGLCKLAVAGLEAPPIALATAEPKAGDPIFAVGMNAAGEFAATEGTIKRLVDSPNGKVIELSVPVAATASGGGVFDPYGRLVGIAVTPHKYGANLHVALPASWISQIRSRGRSQ